MGVGGTDSLRFRGSPCLVCLCVCAVVWISGAKSKTFKPVKGHAKGSKRYELHRIAKATLGSGNMQAAVMLPKGENLEEWLAVNSKFCC